MDNLIAGGLRFTNEDNGFSNSLLWKPLLNRLTTQLHALELGQRMFVIEFRDKLVDQQMGDPADELRNGCW